jgi:uncharacterized protein DUF4304
MTARATPKEIYDRVVEGSAQKLRDLNFSRRGVTLRKISNGNAAIIEFQKSVKSGREKILFTINLGVVCGKLLEEWPPALARAGSIDAHLRERIGMLLPERSDKWWQIGPETDADALVSEVSRLIFEEAVPYL